MIACRVLGGLFCAFYNGRDARCDSCGRDARHPDKGRDAWCPCYAAKMAAFPVRSRQARPLPWRRSRGDRPTWRSGCSLRGTSHIRISEVARDQPGGVIVPHRNRTRVLGGFYNGRDASCAICGRDARHPDKGQDARRPSCAAKMAAFPVRPRQAWPLPWWIAPPSEAARAQPPRGATSAVPPVAAVAGRPPYLAKRMFFARYVTYSHK